MNNESQCLSTEKKVSPFVKADWLKLLPILALAFYLSFIPHLNYPYPVHVDEWVQMVLSQAIVAAQHTSFTDPFFGNSLVTLSSNLEAGFQLFLGSIQQVSGLSWEVIFRFLPSIISVFCVLSVYIITKKHQFGWEAALLTALIPTSVGILGPAFLVPVSLGLVFIPLSLFAVFHFKDWRAYLLLFIFCIFLLAMHAPSAVCLVILLLPYIVINLKRNFKHSAGILLALAIPFLAVFPWIFALLLPTAKALLQPIAEVNLQGWSNYTYLPQIVTSFGYLPVALCLVGVFALYIQGGKEKLGLVLALVVILIMLVVFFTFHYGVWILYLRGLMFALLMIGMVAGAGLMAIKEIKIPGHLANFKVPGLGRHIGYLFCTVVVIVVLAIAIPARQNTIYYEMIDREDAQAFSWIQKNVPADYRKAILDPWEATAFTALTRKNIYTKIHATVTISDKQAEDFLKNACSDTAFLQNNGISIVYTTGPVSNQNLEEVRRGVYLLKK